MPYDHFYTTNPTGELAPSIGYHYEGIAGYVFTKQEAKTVPIYRAYNTVLRDHFYTADKAEEIHALENGYTDEGVGYYMYPAPHEGAVPFYRWYNATSGDPFYTTDPKGELAKQAGYVYEEISGYLFPPDPTYIGCECRREYEKKGERCACKEEPGECRCRDSNPLDSVPLFRWYLSSE